MKKVLFADDDILTINKLSNIIDWEVYGYEIIQAFDGEEALVKTRKQHPDLIILDIEMPKINGLEVVKRLREQAANVPILILSNHDDFEFVRGVMRYGVSDYLLKHQLKSKILLEKLMEINAIKKKEELSRNRNNYFAGVAKEQFLRQLLLNPDSVKDNAEMMISEAEFSSRYYVLIVFQVINFVIITSFDEKHNRLKMIHSVLDLVNNIILTLPLQKGLISHIEHGRFIILLCFDEPSIGRITQDANNFVRLIMFNITKFLNIKTVYEIGNAFGSFTDISKHYRQLTSLLENKNLSEPESIDTAVQAEIDIVDEKMLLEALLDFDFEETSSCVKSILSKSSGMEISSYSTQSLITHLIDIGSRFLKTHESSINDPYFDNIKSELNNCLDMSKIESILVKYFSAILHNTHERSLKDYSANVRHAIMYIRHNYTNDISLSTAAQELNLSPAYLSRIFARETGLNFTDYITELRISKCKKLLLAPDAELKKIPEMTGISSYNYFLRLFKEKTGLTPTQYIIQNIPNDKPFSI